jgi:hypothetical protein
MLSERENEIKDIFDGLECTEEHLKIIPTILALILNDMAYEKDGYEEEEYMRCVSDI